MAGHLNEKQIDVPLSAQDNNLNTNLKHIKLALDSLRQSAIPLSEQGEVTFGHQIDVKV